MSTCATTRPMLLTPFRVRVEVIPFGSLSGIALGTSVEFPKIEHAGVLVAVGVLVTVGVVVGVNVKTGQGSALRSTRPQLFSVPVSPLALSLITSDHVPAPTCPLKADRAPGLGRKVPTYGVVQPVPTTVAAASSKVRFRLSLPLHRRLNSV